MGSLPLKFQLDNKFLLETKGFRTAELKAGPVGTVAAAAFAGLIKGQDGIIHTTFLRGVVDPVATSWYFLAQP